MKNHANPAFQDVPQGKLNITTAETLTAVIPKHTYEEISHLPHKYVIENYS